MLDSIRTWIDNHSTWRLLLTYLPLCGAVVVGMVAMFLRHRSKFWFLCAGPAAIALLAFVVAPPVFRDGNVLGLTIYSIYWVALPFYYIGLVMNYSSQMRRRAAAMAAAAAGK
jgi:predicted permease